MKFSTFRLSFALFVSLSFIMSQLVSTTHFDYTWIFIQPNDYFSSITPGSDMPTALNLDKCVCGIARMNWLT